MKNRVIARLDIKKNRLIKGIHLEGLRVVGDPVEKAINYYNEGADELLLIDAVASLYRRNSLIDVVKSICKDIFIPITIGGGIRSLENAQDLFEAGADKIAINTAAVSRPKLISEISESFGKQAVVVSMQIKRNDQEKSSWRVMTDNGRENCGLELMDWLKMVQDLGAGEILLTSIDKEGTGSGFDLELLEKVANSTSVPIQISGGFLMSQHAELAFKCGAQAAVIAQALHYNKTSIQKIKADLCEKRFAIRQTHFHL